MRTLLPLLALALHDVFCRLRRHARSAMPVSRFAPFLALALLACGDKDTDETGHAHHHHGDGTDTASLDYATDAMTDGGSFHVAYTPSPAPIPYNDYFTLDVEVWDADMAAMLPPAVVDAYPEMPEHGHGMNTEATVTANGDGTFLVEGLLFHMTGYWTLDVTVTDGDTTESALFNIWCCE